MRVELRVGEIMYFVVDNNCECFVYWIFLLVNILKQIEESFVEKVVGGGVDGLFFLGIGCLIIYMVFGIIYYF